MQWMPDSLYNNSVSVIASSFDQLRNDIQALPNNLLSDILYKLFRQNRLVQLAEEMTNLDVFLRLLQSKDKRIDLHHCFQGLMDHGLPLAKALSDAFAQKICVAQHKDDRSQERTILSGLSLGSFFSEAGWYNEAETTFAACLQLSKLRIDVAENDPKSVAMSTECCIRLMVVLNANCKYKEAEDACEKAADFLDHLDRLSPFAPVNRAALYGERCALAFAKSQYDAAYLYGERALKELKDDLPPKTVVDVLRQVSKACVVKREFEKAELLVRGAVNLAWEEFGKEHPKFADALLDYGFYLLNVDCIAQSVVVYQLALNVRNHFFKGSNINVAIAHEDLAYATYVLEYSSGHFERARHHAERAIAIITHILPSEHLLLASSKRVKALILEEIAIDSNNKEEQAKQYAEAEELHNHSLSLALLAFGENNVQTAKHYGNLGRLYQSMGKYPKAEEMHLKAIEIKERLLGSEDYEVALSVGHLASLYNYDMQMYDKAEELYFRSIKIGKKLFGDGYSGLEYDYRGLLRLYHSMRNFEKAHEFQAKLHDWSNLRDELSNDAADVRRQKHLADRLASEANAPLTSETMTLDSLKRQFFASPCKFLQESAFDLFPANAEFKP